MADSVQMTQSSPSSLLGLTLWVAEIRLECSSIELRINGVDLEQVDVDVHRDHALNLELVAADPAGVPPPCDLVAAGKCPQGLNSGQRWRHRLRGNEGLFTGERWLVELLFFMVSLAIESMDSSRL